MNRIYSNIKQIALSLLVVGLAISTQAFKSSEKTETKERLFNTVWIVGFDGVNYQYTTTNPGATCSPSSVVPCEVTSSTYPLTDPEGDIPEEVLHSSEFTINSERASY